MKKPKIKKRGDLLTVSVGKKILVTCTSEKAAKLWRDVLGRSETKCRS